VSWLWQAHLQWRQFSAFGHAIAFSQIATTK